MMLMSEERDKRTKEQQNKPHPWRPWRPPRRQTRWWVLWAVGILVALVAMALLIDKRYPGIWENLSRARIEQVASLIAIGVTLTAIIVLLAIGGAALEWTGFGGKTLWDWLQILSAIAIPAVLTVAGFWFSSELDQRQRKA